MMKSAVLLLGAHAANIPPCPLNLKCTSHTISEDLETRLKEGQALKQHFGLTNDLMYRAGDQVAWDLKCPKKMKVPFAIATSMGIYVRVMKTKNSPWRVVRMPVSKFGKKLGCQKLKKLNKLPLVDVKDVKKQIKARHEKCGKGCVSLPAGLVLFPDLHVVSKLPKEIQPFVLLMSASVSSMNVEQRKRLANKKEAHVALFECKGKAKFAWAGLIENKPRTVLMANARNLLSKKSIVQLHQRSWKKRCN